ncbi:MAG: PilZ domain-containing protein [Pyrinomonadaceae bacterium]
MNDQAALAVPPSAYDATERRAEPRLYGLFPATVRGVDARGEEFETTTILENISASVFCLRLKECVEVGAKLHVVARIHKAVVELRGTVVRADTETESACCITVEITHSKFL